MITKLYIGDFLAQVKIKVTRDPWFNLLDDKYHPGGQSAISSGGPVHFIFKTDVFKSRCLAEAVSFFVSPAPPDPGPSLTAACSFARHSGHDRRHCVAEHICHYALSDSDVSATTGGVTPAFIASLYSAHRAASYVTPLRNPFTAILHKCMIYRRFAGAPSRVWT